MPKKYITVNGVLKRNPEYVEPGALPRASDPTALAVVSSLDDVEKAAEVQSATGLAVPMASSTAAAIEKVQDDDFLLHFKSSTPLDGGALLEQIGSKFTSLEVPLGMLSKLLMLQEYSLDFIIDDSGSMWGVTDVDAKDASEPVKTAITSALRREPRTGEKMTRLQEAEDRLHVMIGMLAYIPIQNVHIRFLNSKVPLVLDRSGKTPEEFEAFAHHEIHKRFVELKGGGTPVLPALKEGFDAPGRWYHYLFNDGEPNEGGEAVASFIKRRKDPKNHCFTLISCTNNDTETEWMKRIDNDAKFVAEVDDYQDEKTEVMKKQGVGFPFTRGLWLLCQLVAAFNPDDLDCLDENLPLTRFTLSMILGRELNPKEYQYYFENNPNAELYVHEYERFLCAETPAGEIISKDVRDQRERDAGYLKGERPEGRPIAPIGRLLTPITERASRKFAEAYTIAPEVVVGGGGGGGSSEATPTYPAGVKPANFAARASGFGGMGMFPPAAPPPLPAAVPAPATGTTTRKM